jgi:phosphatidylinositol alpha-1,6-mannosyltransferase
MGEGLPIAILEAGALGLSVVTTRCCGAEEVIEEGESGLLVKLGDEAALADGIVNLLADRKRALEMGAALRRRVMSDFQWHRAWGSYRELAT